MRVECRVSSVENGCRPGREAAPRRSPIIRRGFTLIELLAVISILGLLAALTVPALKDVGKANINASASRQMLDDVGFARQMAMSHRTTVYLVFIPTNFWTWSDVPRHPAWLSAATPAQLSIATNLVEKQLTGYTFLTLRSVGDQPGNPTKRYLSQWKSLPEGTFIDAQKFSGTNAIYDGSVSYAISQFNYLTNSFPTEDSATNRLAYIAFNYRGQLTVDGISVASQDEYIPLARGTVSYGRDADKRPQFTPVIAGDIVQSPAGNSTSIAYNVIHIEALTGRATLEYHKLP